LRVIAVHHNLDICADASLRLAAKPPALQPRLQLASGQVHTVQLRCVVSLDLSELRHNRT
jgi:hypothetical protein